jgi:hypothetical protein
MATVPSARAAPLGDAERLCRVSKRERSRRVLLTLLDGFCGRALGEGLVVEDLVLPNEKLLLRRDVV